MKCDIIIPVWNQLEITRNCVNSLLRYTDYPYRLIIIDNASDKPTRDYLAGLKSVKGLDLELIRNTDNLGFVKAVNQGIRASREPYLCIMNNDTVATDGWLSEMIAVMDRYPRIGLLNPSSNTSGQFPAAGQSIDEYAFSLKTLKGQIQELFTCRGFCMLLRKEVIRDIGILDEVYHIGYFDDTDYCKRAQAKGFRTARAKASYVYHMENVSFKELDNNKALFADNERIFFERWGRHVRVGYFLDKITSGGRIDDMAIQVARGGHQILLFIKKGLTWPVTLDHFDIRRVDIDPVFFSAASVYQILRRKKKKKIDVAVTDNAFFGSILNMLRPIHGADVMVLPKPGELLGLLKERSRQF